MLALNDVSCSYNGTAALAGIRLEFAPGELVAVIGPNGSGKTTLLRAAGRAMKPRSGSVLLEGRDLYALDARSAALSIAAVPQDAEGGFEFTAGEIVLMGRHPYVTRFGAETARDHDAVRVAMERTGTWDLRMRPLAKMSGGERRRVLVARALAQAARILLLDEPTTHLDVHHQVETLRTARAEARAGKVIVVVLHDLNLAAAFATRIVLLHQGKVVAEGPPAKILTGANLVPVFGAELTVRDHPDGGPLIVPRTS